MAGSLSVTIDTNCSVDKYNFTWIINNFTRYVNGAESDTFTPLSNKKTEFSVCFRLGENISTFQSQFTCVFSLKRIDDDAISTFDLGVEHVVKFLDFKGKELLVFPKKVWMPLRGGHEIDLVRLQTPGETSVDYKNRWLLFNKIKAPSDDTVMVKILFKFFGHRVNTKSIAPILIKPPHQPLLDLTSDFRNLYKSKILTDVTIRIDDNVIQAHQSVLAARCPVFKRMLESSCLESNVKCLIVTDVDFEVFECFLEYLYTGVLEDKTFSMVYRLYSVAVKYSVSYLREDCVDILATVFEFENVCDVLELSYLHNDKKLEKNAAFFVSMYYRQVKSEAKWKALLKKYPEFTSELLEFIVKGF